MDLQRREGRQVPPSITVIDPGSMVLTRRRGPRVGAMTQIPLVAALRDLCVVADPLCVSVLLDISSTPWSPHHELKIKVFERPKLEVGEVEPGIVEVRGGRDGDHEKSGGVGGLDPRC